MADKEAKFSLTIKISVCVCLLQIFAATVTAHVMHFESSEFSKDGISVVKHSLHKRDTNRDPICQDQENKFLHNKKEAEIDKEFTFSNESKYAMALAWAGKNDGTLIVVTSSDIQGVTLKSSLYRSTDFGATFEDITETFNIKEVIRKHNGLQRHRYDAKKVYLVTESHVLYITEDGGKTFESFTAPMQIEGELIFHPSKHYQDYILAKDPASTLYMSKDNGRNWDLLLKDVEKCYWGNPDVGDCCDTGGTVYAAQGDAQGSFLQRILSIGLIRSYTLKKYEIGQDWTTILENIISFERSGKFLYASVLTDPKDITSSRYLKISVDSGKTWREAQLPTIESDREMGQVGQDRLAFPQLCLHGDGQAPVQFYSVMEMENDMIFMHVDNPDDTGHGVLYTSGNDGIVYSESLRRHLYPNFGVIHDFYKVQSMRGVYITSQMNDDDSIHSMISYNRGATWQKIPRPDNAPCKDETKECNLQVHGMYSMQRRINILPPQSEQTAVGIIMVHANVAESLQKSDADVYVSSDGGYSWRLSLKGPHHYQIGDHGGFLAAVSKSEPNPNIVKFSTDEGNCWHEYQFTNKTLNFTGLLTEPEGHSSVVMIWGYTADTRKWEVHIIDFKDVIPRKCTDTDYEAWMAHSQHRAAEKEDVAGCLLGQKESFLRLKKDSWCYNGYDHEVERQKTNCNCTREDYECDYGYYRPGGSDICYEIPEFKRPAIDICLRGHTEEIISEGYRKIPGDSCQGGFVPSSRKIDLKKKCKGTDKSLIKLDETPETVSVGQSQGVKTAIIILVIIVMALALLMSIYFIRKFIILRRHKVEYRYSLLNQSERERDIDHDLENALHPTSVVFDDSDEEELQTTNQSNSSSSSRPNGNVLSSKPDYTKTEIKKPYHSYHDDSDDDLLS